MTPTRARLLCALLLSTLVLVGCAWSNPEYRPIFNAYQQTLVPEDDVLFWISTPLTVPLGIVAFVLDLFVGHPLQVVGPVTSSMKILWTDIDWQGQYYSQTAFCLVRAPATVVAWVLAMLHFCVFDGPLPGEAPEEPPAVTEPVPFPGE